MRGFVGGVGLALVLAVACTPKSGFTDDCYLVPKNLACQCPDGRQGTRECKDDTLLPCECPEAGAPTTSSDGGINGADSSSACVPAADDCFGRVNDCCPGSVCVGSTVDDFKCAAYCTAHSQCVSGCCAMLPNTGALVCSPVTFCR